jgi:hypothetical protein
MKLRYDPYQVFRFSKTPAGLYARQKWLGEADRPQWKIEFQETTAALWKDQLPDGSWRHSPLTTIRQLFGLHLTVREASAGIRAALKWLLDKIKLRADKIIVACDVELTAESLQGLPFVAGRQDLWMVAAVLFLTTIFGAERDPDISALYRWLSALGIQNKGQWFDKATSHNIFRALVVHPVFAGDKATRLAVEHFATLQTENGEWQNEVPFFQTLNALAHLDLAQAESQLEKAFKRLFENQYSDGTWSRSEPEWHAFLAIHALKNKGLL